MHGGTGSYHEYDPPLRGAVNKTVDMVWTDVVFGPGPYESIVAVCSDNICLPTAAVFGTNQYAILSASADGGYFPALGGAMGLDTYKTGSSQYAIVAGSGNDGIQIIDISKKMAPVSAGYVYEQDIPGVADPYDVEVYKDGRRSIALVTSHNLDSVQMLDVSRPSHIQDLGVIYDGKEFDTLDGASRIHTLSLRSDTYALISSYEGIQLINLTDGMSPVSSMALDDARGLDTIHDASGRYAVVAAGPGIHVVNLTDISNPYVVLGINDGSMLDPAVQPAVQSDLSRPVPRNVAIAGVGSGTYALVTWSAGNTSEYGDGLQIINMTDVSAPEHMTWIGDSLAGAYDVTSVRAGSDTYALVTAYRDAGLRAFNISNPESSHLASSVHFPGATHLSYIDGCAAVTSFETESVYMVCRDAHPSIPDPSHLSAGTLGISTVENSTPDRSASVIRARRAGRPGRTRRAGRAGRSRAGGRWSQPEGPNFGHKPHDTV